MSVIKEDFKMRPKHNWYSKIVRKFYKIRVNKIKPKNPIPDKQILEKAQKEKELVIQPICGGLGDHLTYSSLPELLLKQKGIKTYISNYSVFDSKAICDFVWGYNPHIEFTDRKGWFTYQQPEHSFLSMDKYFQSLFELDGDGLPKIYYKPKIIKQIKGKTIVDPSFGPAGKANGYFEPDFEKKFIEYFKKEDHELILILHRHSNRKNRLEEKLKKSFSPACYEIRTIQELVDVLSSAENRYILHSGTASISAALNKKSNVLNYYKPPACNHFKYSCNNHIDLLDV